MQRTARVAVGLGSGCRLIFIAPLQSGKMWRERDNAPQSLFNPSSAATL